MPPKRPVAEKTRFQPKRQKPSDDFSAQDETPLPLDLFHFPLSETLKKNHPQPLLENTHGYFPFPFVPSNDDIEETDINLLHCFTCSVNESDLSVESWIGKSDCKPVKMVATFSDKSLSWSLPNDRLCFHNSCLHSSRIERSSPFDIALDEDKLAALFKVIFKKRRMNRVEDLGALELFIWKSRLSFVNVSFYWDRRTYVSNSQIFGFVTKPLMECIEDQNTLISSLAAGRNFTALEEFVQDSRGDAEAQTPDGFLLDLRDYQKQSLSWMKRIENGLARDQSCIANVLISEYSMVGYDFTEQRIFRSDELPYNMLVKGGILADETGVGKTVTMLALCQACPCPFQFSEEEMFVPGTLIICPFNLINQWSDEISKCLGLEKRVLCLPNCSEMAKYSLEQVATYDFIIIPFESLRQSHHSTCTHINIFKIAYYRVVIDEIHEIVYNCLKGGYVQNALYSCYFNLRTKFRWGMSATCRFQQKDVVKVAEILGVNFPTTNNLKYCQQFLDCCVRRNSPDLNLPPLINEAYFISMTLSEETMYHSLGSDPQSALMLCNHFAMNSYGNHLQLQRNNQVRGKKEKLSREDLHESLVTVDEVAAFMQSSRNRELDRLTKSSSARKIRISEQKEELEKMYLSMTEDEFEDLITDIEEVRKVKEKRDQIQNNCEKLKEEEAKMAVLEREISFFNNVTKLLHSRQDESCPICLDDFLESSVVALTRCGHYFCRDCIKQVSMRKKCSLCRGFIDPKSVYLVKPITNGKATCSDADKNEENSLVSFSESHFGAENCDLIIENLGITDHYGSKIKDLASYLRVTVEKDPTNRIIVFCQFKRMSVLVSQALHLMNIPNANACGDIRARVHAIEKFKQHGSGYRVIILNSENSVSGLNLTEASHVVILHPFYYGAGEQAKQKALAFEKQGIARAFRSGQTRRVTVTRFIVKETIEAELYFDRQ